MGGEGGKNNVAAEVEADSEGRSEETLHSVSVQFSLHFPRQSL